MAFSTNIRDFESVIDGARSAFHVSTRELRGAGPTVPRGAPQAAPSRHVHRRTRAAMTHCPPTRLEGSVGRRCAPQRNATPGEPGRRRLARGARGDTRPAPPRGRSAPSAAHHTSRSVTENAARTRAASATRPQSGVTTPCGPRAAVRAHPASHDSHRRVLTSRRPASVWCVTAPHCSRPHPISRVKRGACAACADVTQTLAHYLPPGERAVHAPCELRRWCGRWSGACERCAVAPPTHVRPPRSHRPCAYRRCMKREAASAGACRRGASDCKRQLSHLATDPHSATIHPSCAPSPCSKHLRGGD
jgi:hypothetical protein